MSSDGDGQRGLLAMAALLVLAAGGLVVLAVAALAAITYCYDICDTQSEEWSTRPGAWERWAQFAAASTLAVLLLAAARAGSHARYRTASLLVLLSAPVLTAWLVIFIVDG
jgi:hypothetical protein